MKTAVIFDLDGTLVDSSPDIAAALNKAFAPWGVSELTAPEVLGMLGGGPRALIAQALTAIDGPLDDESLDEALARYSAEYLAAPSAKTEFFADAAKVIPKLAARGLKLGICTNKRTELADLLLEHLGVRAYFSALVGVDRAAYPKPHPMHLEQTMAELDVTPEECVYVGDTAIDQSTARAAGVRYTHVAWGHEIEGNDTRLECFEDLMPIVEPPGSPPTV
ncbi:HAD family hydrolase [Leucobacter komagatae]|uniref:Phosphoglycolate phosphatase n=1 Tax=Leucobacter komagatae TaxID=55969 RepID=A0A0D0IIR7_9MICO|nr:HAD-IA family hydrolase [Leucobacter komagatae]KIP51504.1 hypothetical protein SD72_15045 [Leucobacter komagatae]